MSTNTPYRPHNHGPATRPPAASALSSLLAQANSLNEADYDSELPQIRFGIDDIERMSEVVAGRGKRVKSEKGEAFNLLSNLGVNTSQLAHSISQLPSEPAAPRPRRRRAAQVQAQAAEQVPELGRGFVAAEGDIGTWGRNWHEMVILSGIEMQRQRIINSFQKQFQQRILQNWQLEKARVLQDELGVTDDELAGIVDAARLASSALGSSSLGRSALGASTRRFPMGQSTLGKSTTAESREGGLVMHTKMVRYERAIGELNQKRLRKEPYEFCQALSESTKNDSPVNERQYSAAYLGDQKAHQAALLRGRLVTGGLKYLERDFERHVDETIARNPKEAALGGVPGIRNKIRAFVDVTLRTKEAREAYKPETVNGTLLWAQTYYLVRCGYIDDALNLVAENQQHISRDDWSFPGCFKSAMQSPERRLSKTQRDQLYNDFNAHIRNNPLIDQFKAALYKLVGRFELNRKTAKVATTTEDWMWLQLNLVRENRDGDAPQEQYDLADLGRLLEKYGSDKFDANGTKPLAWFNLLLFTAQFEKAVAYLYSKPQMKTDAVHFAIALSYYGLLRVPPKGDEAELLAVSDSSDVSFLNFARIIKQYIAPFFKLEPQTALQYAYLVMLNSDAPAPSGPKQRQLCLELVRDIVLSSRSWSRLLGSVRADGSKEIGVIERDLKLLKLEDEQDYLRQVVLAAADQSSLDSSLTDSIELYHLAGSYDKVVETVNRALGHSLSQTAGAAPLPSDAAQVGLTVAFGGAPDLYSLAQKVHAVYERDFGKRTRVSSLHWETLETLLQLKLALAQFAADRPDLALETFKATNLLPLDNDPSSITRYAQKFRDMLDQPVISNLDDVIVTTMKCLHLLSQQLKQSPYGDQGRAAQLSVYKHQAQCLIQFASTLRLRLGPDVYRQLSSMSAFF
ncbi:nucleoporin-interacting protein NIC96, putative [Cryptococcus gattii WM276]|uniref:Nuclear pore protein n=1 Tax=Cryptococcus gattii serotype B (strain WM276 / ATCC MYA-4071) TaxID=367775 RepID=E6R1S1_CRYGW|nr:nucleoporin-interacting protein NIC96, putative [Cryptococcus gattii WM276]ADV21182.1 nucleoporin-interacting protein NIC96, putative [Cryptococcus gattii WM276]